MIRTRTDDSPTNAKKYRQSNDAHQESASVRINNTNSQSPSNQFSYVETYEKIHFAIEKLIIEIFADETVCRSFSIEIITRISDLVTSLFTDTLSQLESSCVCHKTTSAVLKMIKSMFAVYKTDYRITKHFSQLKYFIPSESRTISLENYPQQSNGHKSIVPKPVQVEIVPIAQVLEIFFSNRQNFDVVMTHIEKCKKQEEITSPLHGTVWKSVESLFIGKIVLPLLLFFDDFQINNPLSKHAKDGKLGAVYISLLCVPEEYRSTLENIFLAQLHKTKDHANSTNTRIFAAIISQLKDLETTGIEVSINGEKTRIYFVLLSVCGDNLGQNTILGFVPSFNANYCCRICISDKTQRKTWEPVKEGLLRNKQNYAEHVKILTYGIVEKCIFNELKYYHVITHMTLDILHDFREGIWRYTMGALLYYLIIEKEYFTLEDLNWKIKYFDYGCTKNVNIPPPITVEAITNKYIILSGAEMKSLSLNLAFYVGPLIPESDEKWKIYLLLRKININVESSSFTAQKIANLRFLIHEFLKLYMEHFGNAPFKFHLLNHYPDKIEAQGPPKYYSTIRFEAKHKPLKKIALTTTSRLNAPHTIAHKNQFNLCLKFMHNNFLSVNIETGPEIKINMDAYTDNETILLEFLVHDNSYITSWACIYGSHYQAEMCIVLSRDEYDNDTFGQIKYIAVNKKSQLTFFYQKLKTEFVEHVQGYQVLTFDEYGVIAHTDLPVYKPRIISVLSNCKNFITAL